MDQSLKTVFLHGRLRDLVGQESVRLSGDSVYELIEGISVNYKEELRPTPNRERIVVKVRDFDTEDEIRRPLKPEETEIHIYPTLMGGGGKNGGLFKMIVGVLLVAVVAWAVISTGGAALLMAGPNAWGLTWLGSAMLTSGIGLIVGGLMEQLMPQPKIDMSASNDIEASKYIGAQGNTIKIGTVIPLILGRHRGNGHFISFNVDAMNVAT